MLPDRRNFLTRATAATAALTGLPLLLEAGAPRPGAQAVESPSGGGAEQIAMVIYPQSTALDFVGPQYAFGCLSGATVHHVAATMDPITTDTEVTLTPTTTFDQCPREVDVLFVPGGTNGTLAALRHDATLDFIADCGARAKWVTSVCTGSLLLGAAGLLHGYRATAHWATRDLLTEVGAAPTDSRVVVDGNRVTAAGVSAGLDLGFLMLSLLRDRHYAETVQLMAEYAPAPPFDAGSPHTAPPATTAMVDNMFTDFRARAEEVLLTRR